MKKNVFRKKLLTLLMIISIVATDFFVLGSNLLTYSNGITNETNNPNVEFSAYFKDEIGQRVDTIDASIKSENLKLYAEIIVKNEGYLNAGTAIEIEDSNFNIKNNISSPYINTISGNKVVLKQITAGETVEISLDIEPKILDNMSADMLTQTSVIKLNGSYTGSTDGGIQYGKQVCIEFKTDETAKAELVTDIITNAVLSVDGTNKRVVQLLVKSRLTENQYPVSQTKLNVGIPKLGSEMPEVSVIPIGILATNGTNEISSVKTENDTIKMEINNNADENNKINWVKNAYDEIIVTYLYPETVDATDMEIVTNLEIKVISSEMPYTNTHTEKAEQELKNVIIGRTEIIQKEMYKGRLYTSDDEEYNTKTTLAVTKEGIVEKITINEGQDTFGTEKSEVVANTKYINTEINLEKMLAIFGEDGNIEIKNGENVIVINKNSTANEEGNVIVTYEENATSELIITTSNPVKEGVLEIYHTKAITGIYTRSQLKDVKTLNAKGFILGIVEYSMETVNSKIELKETISKAELVIENNKNRLSTTEENEMTLGITLVTDNTKYDLYKNPSISIKFPADVENVILKSTPSKQNMNEFTTINVGEFNKNNKTLQIDIQGEQKIYAESLLTQSYLQLSLNVTLSQLATNKKDKIMMAYINENASQYFEETAGIGIAETIVEISAQPGLFTMFNMKPDTQLITNAQAGKEIILETILVNNTDTDLNNIKVLGKIPTTGNIIDEQENTLETVLTNIEAEGAKISYTENVNATIQTEEVWTNDLKILKNAKMYQIELEKLPKASIYKANITIKLPKVISSDMVSYSVYEVICDEITSICKSRKLGLMTSPIAGLETNLTAKVGNEILKEGDKVKEGEVIKYTVTVQNKGNKTLQNVQLKGEVPEETVVVEPVKDFEYEKHYYEEKTDIKEIDIIIPTLEAGKTYTTTYEVRVNTNNTAGTEISNKATIIYNNSSIKSEELKNIIEEADVRVSVKNIIPKILEGDRLQPGDATEYSVYIENISKSIINNLEVQIIANGFNIQMINNNTDIPERIVIDELSVKDANNEDEGEKTFVLYGKIPEYAEKLEICAIITDAAGNKYRSNIVEETLPFIDAQISMKSIQDGKTIKEGDKVEYNINIKNTGNVESILKVKDSVSELLKIKEIKFNDKTVIQSINENNFETYIEWISNDIDYMISLSSNEIAKLDIIAEVKYIPKVYNGKTINNSATVECNDIIKGTSKIITHILETSFIEENVGNIIRGFVWLDTNENGKRDEKEASLEGINVKIYDYSTKTFLVDEKGNEIKSITDNNGEYIFENINSGLYLIVFDCDMNKYELTKTNSKAELKTITINNKEVTVVGIDTGELKENIFNMNLGLKKYSENQPEEKPENSTNPDTPTEPEQPEIKTKNTISGFAWLDENRNGQKDKNEKTLEGIKARLYDVSNKNIAEVTTDIKGNYVFKNIEDGQYIILFEYNTEEYEPTIYLAEGVQATENSKVVLKKININGEEKTLAVTDRINVQDDVANINIGLKEKLVFDLELNKYISRIVVQTAKETKSYDYQKDTFEKVEIHRKEVQGALVVLEYTIKVKNNGKMPGYAKNIVDYLPNDLTFTSELNKEWYLIENQLYTKSFENTELKPGEEKEIKLILTKTMTNENLGLINNRAEIYQDYNKFGDTDIDSKPNNQEPNEDDFGTADIIIQVATGGSIIFYIILVIINIVLIGIAINIIKKKLKRKGGNNLWTR